MPAAADRPQALPAAAGSSRRASAVGARTGGGGSGRRRLRAIRGASSVGSRRPSSAQRASVGPAAGFAGPAFALDDAKREEMAEGRVEGGGGVNVSRRCGLRRTSGAARGLEIRNRSGRIERVKRGMVWVSGRWEPDVRTGWAVENRKRGNERA